MQQPINPPPQIPVNLSLAELTELLIKHYSIHEGLYDLAFHFQIAVGAVGPQPDQVIPGAMIGVNGVSLAKTENSGPNTVDASVVNPKKTTAKRAKATAK